MKTDLCLSILEDLVLAVSKSTDDSLTSSEELKLAREILTENGVEL